MICLLSGTAFGQPASNDSGDRREAVERAARDVSRARTELVAAQKAQEAGESKVAAFRECRKESEAAARDKTAAESLSIKRRQELMARKASSRQRCDVTYAKQSAEISGLRNERDALTAERRRALWELQQGLYCSECGRPKSQIEREERVSFELHLRKVRGRAKPATKQQLDRAARSYDTKIAAITRRGEAATQKLTEHVNRCNAELAQLDSAIARLAADEASQRQAARSSEALHTCEKRLSDARRDLETRRAALGRANDQFSSATAALQRAQAELAASSGNDLASLESQVEKLTEAIQRNTLSDEGIDTNKPPPAGPSSLGTWTYKDGTQVSNVRADVVERFLAFRDRSEITDPLKLTGGSEGGHKEHNDGRAIDIFALGRSTVAVQKLAEAAIAETLRGSREYENLYLRAGGRDYVIRGGKVCGGFSDCRAKGLFFDEATYERLMKGHLTHLHIKFR